MQNETFRERANLRVKRLTMSAAAVATVASMFGTSTRAGVPVYWDINGTNAEAGGTAPSGTWNTTNAFWGDSAGTATTVPWNNASPGGDTAVFSAGDDATGTYSISTAGPLTLAGITIEDGTQVSISPATTVYNFAGPSSSLTIDVQPQGTLMVFNARYNGTTIIKNGNGILNPGANPTATFGGKWVVNGGTIAFGGDLRISQLPGAVTPDQITLNSGGMIRNAASNNGVAFTANRGITLGVGGGGFNPDVDSQNPNNIFTTIWTGPITGNVGGDLQKEGVGFAILTNTNNNYDGNTVIRAGTLGVGASNVIPDTSVVSQTAGTFDLATASTNETVKSISGTAGKIALSSTSTLTLDNPAGETAAQTLNVPAGGKIVKNGAGALTLSGDSQNNDNANGFRGEFILNSGTLGVGTSTMLGGSNTPTATLTINGGTLSNPDGTAKNLNAALITNLSGDFAVDDSLSASPGVIRFNGGTATIRNSDRTITVSGDAVLDFAGTLAEDVAGRSLTKAGNGVLRLTGTTAYTGATTVNGGRLVVTNGIKTGNALTVASGADAVIPATTPDTFSPPTVVPAGTDTAGSKVSSLSITGTGQLDLNNNDMVIDHDGSLDIADIRDLIGSGYNFGGQDGPGIISTTAALTDPFTFTLGYGDNASLPLPYGTTIGFGTLFAGFDPDDTAALIKFTWVGDVTLDGVFDFQDLSIFNGNYDAGATTGRVWTDGDLNYDGTIDFQDLSLFNGTYDPSKPSLPEPASMLMLAPGLFALLSRRRRRVRTAGDQ